MREQLRGFAQGVKFLAGLAGESSLATELDLLASALESHEVLRDVLGDPSIEGRLKSSILSDLFGSAVSPFALMICSEAIALEAPGKVLEAIIQLPEALREPLEEATGALTTTSRVRAFSRALFGSVAEPQRLAAIEEKLFELRDIVAGNPRLRRALSGVGTVAEQRVGIIADLLAGSVDAIFLESLRFAASAGRIRDFVEVLELMAKIVADLRHTRVAEIRVAKPLTEGEQAKVSAAISRAVGSVVELREIIDPVVMGGILAVVGETIFDGSVRHRLDELKGRLGLATAAR